MKQPRNLKKLIRAVGVVTALTLIISGVTFAALQSQQDMLIGNTIETATSNLQLSMDGINFSESHIGFDFNNLIPGGQAQPTIGYPFYLKNAGGTLLAIKFAVKSVPSNPNNVDLSKINVLLTTVGSGSSPQSFSLQSLINSSASGGLAITSGNISTGLSQQYKLQIAMNSDAMTGSSASIGNIDFAFTGVAQSD